MDLWIMGNKAALLLFLIAKTVFPDLPGSSWIVFACLLYATLNVAIPIFKRPMPKAALAVLSSALVAMSAHELDPLFALLLPAGIIELVLLLPNVPRYTVLLGAVPALTVPRDSVSLFLLVAATSLLIYTGLQAYSDKQAKLERARDSLQEDLEKITRKLNENRDFLRQSAYTIKLEERNRLSQTIHDEIGHSMAGALIQMEASRRLLETDKPKAAELLSNAIAISKEGLERIRLTLKDMKPKSEELGIHRLRLFAEELSAKHGIAAKVTYEGDVDAISPIHWKIIHDNATEAATNSLKYGGATAIDIEVKVLNRMIRFIVADNGRGAGKIVKGLGIAGMEERAASAGGTVVVDGSGGFRVTTLLPYGGEG